MIPNVQPLVILIKNTISPKNSWNWKDCFEKSAHEQKTLMAWCKLFFHTYFIRHLSDFDFLFMNGIGEPREESDYGFERGALTHIMFENNSVDWKNGSQ